MVGRLGVTKMICLEMVFFITLDWDRFVIPEKRDVSGSNNKIHHSLCDFGEFEIVRFSPDKAKKQQDRLTQGN